MLIKTQPDEIQSYLSDASNLSGFAERVVFPESSEEVAGILEEATRRATPVTVSGAGTGIVGGRVPQGGIVLATDRLNRVLSVVRERAGGHATAQAGILLADFQRIVAAEGLFYPPDPTERSCFLGGTVATNASGARSFKYGATRNYIRRLQVALATGELIEFSRGEIRANDDGWLRVPLNGKSIQVRVPTFRMPATRKHASGYYITPQQDLIDLFIGSEGTLGVITEVETVLLDQPEGLLSAILFFASDEDLLAFVRETRDISLQVRASLQEQPALDARALEYFDDQSLTFLRQKYPEIPEQAVVAIFFEQETRLESEDYLMDQWLSLLEKHRVLGDESWFATNERDQEKLREFRHQLPVQVNEWLSRHGQRKISTDIAVPDDAFPDMLTFYRQVLRASDISYVIFGHIGDNHVHVNMLPRDEDEAAKAQEIYVEFIKRAVALGGTVSAEHGIGKLKRRYLEILYSREQLKEMITLKRAFDPNLILGRGNMFSEELLGTE